MTCGVDRQTEPEGPITATKPLRGKVSETSSSATIRVSDSADPYTLVTDANRRASCADSAPDACTVIAVMNSFPSL